MSGPELQQQPDPIWFLSSCLGEREMFRYIKVTDENMSETEKSHTLKLKTLQNMLVSLSASQR